MSNFTIGCDPEFFLRERESGKLISAIPFVKGTKEQPMPLPKGGNIQRDNVAVEVATDPASTLEQFIANIQNTLSEAVKVLPKNTEIVALPSACFDEDQLEDPEAQKFGCDPDYNAWTMYENEKPCATDATFRSCGAHIHVGSNGEDENKFLLEIEGKILMIKVMDCLHGVISTVLDSGKEAIDRRQLYGKPGAHRIKWEYGVEYRVLSNYWLKSPVTVMLMYSLTQDALRLIREDKATELIGMMGENEVQNTIMSGNVESAMKMIEVHLFPVMSEESKFHFNEALAKVRANDMDFHKEWKLYEEAAA